MSNKPEIKDVAVPVSTNTDGSFNMLRATDEGVFYDTYRTVAEGQPLTGDGEVVHLTPDETKTYYNVETLYGSRPTVAKSGPAQVASKSYRDGYDRIFSKSKTESSTLN